MILHKSDLSIYVVCMISLEVQIGTEIEGQLPSNSISVAPENCRATPYVENLRLLSLY
jgi:hypothetical protein